VCLKTKGEEPVVRKLLVLVVPALAVAVALAASGSAFAAGGDAPRRDGGHGVWFTRVCAIPGAALGACGAQVVTNSGGSPLAGGSPAPTALGPAQFHSAYGLPTTAPTTQTIAIVDAFDHPNIESDLATFSSFYGLPQCTTVNGCFRKVNQAGGTSYPATNSGWALEIALDVETAHAICQNCKILLVEASSASLANLGAAENRAVAMGANVISNSWGATEYFSETLDETRYFNHPGVVITASTGDNGYEVQFPAASQYVTAVGGTTLHLNGNGSWGSETAWDGTGSGCSFYIAKPSWQTDAGCSGRTVADVSADADPNTGAAVYDSVTYQLQSGWFQVGGTSLAAPLIAAVYALTGTASSANYGAAPYASPSLLHDITSGNNGSCSPSYLCTAGVGFDGPTGLGTPNGLGAFTTGAPPPPPPPPPPPTPDFTVGASPSSANVTQGTNASYTVSVGATGGFSGTVALTQSGLPNGAFAPSSVTGSGSSTLTVSTSTIAPGTYPFTITGTSGSTTHSVQASLVVQSVQTGPPPDFSISVSPSSRTVLPPATSTFTVSITPSNGFSGPVTLSASGFPAGMSGSFAANPVTSSTTFTVTSAGGIPFFTRATIRITGTSGSLSHSTTISILVI
jgi:subtilase family serine protease